ncbi:unnamed protein product [Symbiodinium sp. CCMP2592]|nr:unnamed protein product [Symbiodinium sp. CCMP2592]
MKRRRLLYKQPLPAAPSSDELGQVRTLVRDKWVASYLAEHGRGGQDARAAAKREFTSAANKRQMLSSMLESGQVPPRLHAAATRLIMAWTSETPLRGPHEVEEDVMSSYRGSGTMFRYSGSWSRVDDAAMSAVLVAKGHNGISEVCSRLKCHPYVQGLWDEFSAFRQQLVSSTPITRWTAAMELHVEASLAANPPIPSVHIHFMFDAIGKTISFRNEPGLKFRNSQPYRSLAAPVARGRACKRAYDQGHFYLTPLKTGAILHATNAPPFKSYAVSPEWITSMWQGDKLSPESAKELYLKCKKHVKQYCDNVTSQVQMTQQSNLQERQAAAQAALLRMHRPRVYLEPVEQEFLPQFQVDAFRRRFLVLDGPTKLGKTIFASSLAGPEHTLELNCASSMEPNLRDFNNDVHRAIVFDEASCAMVLRHKKLFQGGVQPLELASSNTNCYSYKVWVYGTMMIDKQHLVACLRRKISSLSRTRRAEKQREANMGLNPRQVFVLLAIYVLTGDPAVALEYISAKAARERMEEADAEDKKRYVEELYLKTSLEDIASLQDPSGSRQGIYKTAQRWIARRRTRNFVCNMNAIGVAPSSEQVAEEYRKQSASSVPTTDARGLRAWSSRFRRSFAFRLGKMKAAKPVEDVCAKAVLFWRHAAWLERSSAKQPVYINIDETALAYSFHAAPGLIQRKFHAEVQIRPQDARGCITHVALDSSWNSARHMVSLLTLLGQLFRIRFPQYQAIVVFDAASCHLSPGVIREGRHKGLFMLPVPPGMTSYLQPLDLWCFGPYKKWLERENRQQRICQNGLAFAQAGLPTSEQRLHGKLASLFPEGIPSLEQALSPDEFAQLLPKRHDLTRTFSDWVGGPRREVPVLS